MNSMNLYADAIMGQTNLSVCRIWDMKKRNNCMNLVAVLSVWLSFMLIHKS